ncbi:MAG TPA: YegS/Rv2252/BmrU family lipid kinase [Homoserinimonas sp.]|nr:YegS/Rv2252/BmrU family lipid kinase [Homoserinimonas sp.]
MTPTKTLRIVVAINPAASFGRNHAVGPAVVRSLRGAGHDVTMLSESTLVELLKSVAAAVATKPDALVVVGGDGMVNLAANVLAGSKVALGVVPSGTGNDMARGLGVPIGNTQAAIEALLLALHQPPRIIDAGRVLGGDGESSWFASVLSAGFDAVVNERANLMRWPKGKSRYNLALLRELAMLRPVHYRLTVDGTVIETDAVLISVANNTSFGGGMLVTPDALLDDGEFDVLVVKPLSRIAFLRIFPRVFKGTHISDPRVTIYRGRSIRVEADGVVAYADGERIGPLPVDIEAVPRALRVLAPKPSPRVLVTPPAVWHTL